MNNSTEVNGPIQSGAANERFYDQRQRRLLVFGGVFNGLFGIVFFVLPFSAPLFWMIQPPPEPGALWLRLDGIFLMITAAFYWLASRDPNRYVGIVFICICGKIISVVFYSAYIAIAKAPLGYGVPTVVDLILFFAHTWALGPNRWNRINDAFKTVEI